MDDDERFGIDFAGASGIIVTPGDLRAGSGYVGSGALATTANDLNIGTEYVGNGVTVPENNTNGYRMNGNADRN